METTEKQNSKEVQLNETLNNIHREKVLYANNEMERLKLNIKVAMECSDNEERIWVYRRIIAHIDEFFIKD